MKITTFALTAGMLFGASALIGCSSDSGDYGQAAPASSRDRGGASNGAFGENPERHSEYAAPDTGTTSSDRAPAAANYGGAK